MTNIPAQISEAVTQLPSPVCAYIYDLKAFGARIRSVRSALPNDVTLLYAMKANPAPPIVTTAAERCHGIEVASGGELVAALEAKAESVVFGGPAKTDAELHTAVAADVPIVINVESIEEVRRLDLITRDRETSIDIALRVNRNAPTPQGSHLMTGVATPFGMDTKKLDHAVALARKSPRLRIKGLHLHAVSNNLDAETHADFVSQCLDFSRRKAQQLGLQFTSVNAGGGIGVDPQGKRIFDFAHFAQRLHDMDTTGLILELGRYLAADIGWYACEVVDIKSTHGKTFAVVRGGTHHFRLPAAWGYSHPAAVQPRDRWPYPWDRPVVHNTEVDVAGELCTPRDVLSRNLPVKRLRIGDALIFPRTGAYAWTISHHDFLSHPHPVEIFLS